MPDEEEEAPFETSLEELLAKRANDRRATGEEEDEESLLAYGRDEHVESLATRVVPQQPNEFTCKRCFLVKHQSQLGDRRRQYCRDCA
ncbi:MAG: DUF4193 family protein [Actinomycetota bacterium]